MNGFEEQSWVDRNYRSIMLFAMGLELLLIAALVVIDVIQVLKK